MSQPKHKRQKSTEKPQYFDLVQLYCDYPLKVPESSRALVDRMCLLYGESLQTYVTDVFYKALDQRDANIVQFLFFMLLNEEDYVINMVSESMPPDKREKLDLFLDYLNLKYKQMQSVHHTERNIEMLIESFTEACATAWSSNLVEQMRQEVEENKQD